MGIFEYNGVTVELDFFDIDTLKKYEEGKDVMSQRITKINADKDLPASERFEKVLNEIDNFFIHMFGKNIVTKMFGKTKNLRDRINAVTNLLKAENSLETDAKEIEKALE
mgnify:CR=1 FL=1